MAPNFLKITKFKTHNKVCITVIKTYYHFLASGAKIPSSNHLIPSINKLIKELPTIVDPLDFCICLEIDYARCHQIQNDRPMNVREQVRAIAMEWYHQSPYRSWEEIVEALFCHNYDHFAVQLATEVHVDWKPLQPKKHKL